MLAFSHEKIVGEVNIPVKISENDIENIVVDSLEVGSNYWVGLENVGEFWKEKPKTEPSSTWATKLILEGKSIKLYDIDGEMDDSNWILTLDKIMKGIRLNAENRSWDSDLEQMDAITADCILQYALFDEIVFG